MLAPELLIFEQMPEMVGIYDAEGRFVYANASLLRCLSTDLGAVQGRRIEDVCAGGKEDELARGVRGVLETGSSQTREHFYRPWRAWLESRFYLCSKGVCMMSLDITGRKRAEEAATELQREKDLELRSLSRLFETIPAALAVLRASDWSYELSNEKNDQIGGRGPLLGKRVPEVLPELVAQGFVALLEQVRRTGEPFIAKEVKVRVGDGEAARELYLNGIYQPMRAPTGEVDRVLAFAYDVTDLVRARERSESLAAQLARSEARARRLSDSGIIGVVFWTRDGRLVDANDAFLAMVGYTRRELRDGQLRWSQMTPPEFAEQDAQAFAELDAKGICAPYAKEYIAKDGRRVPILLGVATWEGTKESGVAWILDMTERRAVEVERDRLLQSERQARAAAEAANVSKDEFLAMVSHELRTPLNAMLGWSKLLRSGILDSAKRERALEAIERNAQAQARLIEDLLDISRIVSGKVRLEVAPVDLAPIIESALETVRPAAESKGIKLEADLEPTLPQLMADASRLRQVAWNLLSNAVKFTPPGGEVTVRLSARGAHLELTVSDTGQGIPQSALPYIFEPFRQADSSITRSFGGLGLGLSISRYLVEMHGGRIEASSRGEGYGATFSVILGPSPVAAAISHRGMRGGVSSPVVSTNRGDLRELRVLVVDDEPDSRELTVAIIGGAGAAVQSVDSAAEALRLLSEESFDVLLSDIGMPVQDGYELLRHVRGTLPQPARDIPAAALTAYARAEDRAQAIAAGFQSVVTKPLDPAEVIRVVASLGRVGSLVR